MSAPSQFTINPNEEFPNLSNSPILEAVIHWDTDSSKILEQISLKEELTKRLPDYPIIQPQYGVQFEIGAFDGMSQIPQNTQWNGFRLENNSGDYVAQFTLTGITFSRIKSYENWESFKTEALRFWHIFVEIAEPKMIRRLGVRFINRIPLKQDESISTYLTSESHKPSGLELSPKSFFYQDTYEVVGYPYQINWVRTIQTEQTEQTELGDGQALILDIDVFLTEIANDQENLNQKLAEMRWLKNRIFFNNITDTALNNFGG